ncbi:aldo/keto reductase [Paraburkholderia sp.]|uniref:aldo/keto reductase n=1 Tax=Paraburkholderia sp. TaxID=1926495 RepID=UPI00286FA06A|nr:aldo/keto reductase [Paraburkholderia sp.]
MESINFRKGELITSCIGLGCRGMSTFYAPNDRVQSDAVLNHAADNGVTLFDTAGDSASEELVGAFLKERTERLSVSTKVGFRKDSERGWIIDNNPKHIRRSCDDSLSRLGVDVIDLYYLHGRNSEVPIAESMGAMRDLQDAGKIRSIGLSEVTSEFLSAASREASIAALQIEYSLVKRSPEQRIIPVARELGVTVVTCSPLGRGLLAGRFTAEDDHPTGDFRSQVSPRLQGKNFRSNMEVIKKFDNIAREVGLPKSTLALAWLFSRGEYVMPIPSTRSIEHLQQNIESTYAHLPADIFFKIDQLFIDGAIIDEQQRDADLVFSKE